MQTRSSFFTIPLLVLASAAGLFASTPVINVDFGAAWTPLYSGQGAANIGGPVWNEVGSPRSRLPVPLLDSHGRTTPVSIQWTSPTSLRWEKPSEKAANRKAIEDLMGDYWYGRTSKAFKLDLTGIPRNWRFDLYVYAAADTNRGALVRVGKREQPTKGQAERQEALTRGVHYVVFNGLTATEGSLSIEAVHRPGQPGRSGIINGFQLVVTSNDPLPWVANATVPAPIGAMSSGLWVILGFGLAIIMVIVVRMAGQAVTASGARKTLADRTVAPMQLPAPNGSGEEPLLAEADHLRQRAEDAEQRARAAETIVREGLMPEMKRLLQNEFVTQLVAERDALLEAQRQAAMDIAAIEQRLTQMQAPVRERLETYERRISDLEKELSERGAENRELLKATIALARQHIEEERARSRFDFN
jgi:hypothetical protein